MSSPSDNNDTARPKRAAAVAAKRKITEWVEDERRPLKLPRLSPLSEGNSAVIPVETYQSHQSRVEADASGKAARSHHRRRGSSLSDQTTQGARGSSAQRTQARAPSAHPPITPLPQTEGSSQVIPSHGLGSASPQVRRASMRLAAKAANAGSSNPRQPTPKRVRHPVEGAGERLPPAVVRLVGLRQGDDTLLAGSAGSTTPAAAAAPTPERATDLDGAHVRPTPAVAAAAVAPSCVIAGGCPEGNAASPLGPASPAAPISTPPIHDGITRPHPPPSTSPTSTLDPHGPGAQPLQGGPSRLGRAPTLLEALQADEGGYGSEETEMSEDEGGASWASFQTLCSSYVEPRATPQLSDADLGQAIVGLELSDFQHKAFQDFRDCRHRLALWSIKSQGSYAHALSLAAAAQRQMMQMREVVQELEARGTPRPPHYLAAWTFYYWQHVDAAHLVARWPPPSSS